MNSSEPHSCQSSGCSHGRCVLRGESAPHPCLLMALKLFRATCWTRLAHRADSHSPSSLYSSLILSGSNKAPGASLRTGGPGVHSRALGATLCRKGARQHLGVQPRDARSTQACLWRHQCLVCSVPGLHCPTSFNLNVLFLKHVSDKAGRNTLHGMLQQERYLLTTLPIL